MQHLIITLALLFTTVLFGQSKSPDGLIKSDIKVTVTNVTSNNGEVRFALYDRENFLKIPLKALSSKINDGKSTVIFEDIPIGEYAIACFHDENGNEQMDFYENGMPKEHYGSSNNPMNLGPPEYELSRFDLYKNDLSLEIKF